MIVLPPERKPPESWWNTADMLFLLNERENIMTPMVSVPVKSAYSSTINWAAFGSMIAGVAAVLGLPVDASAVNTVLAAVPVLLGGYTWVKNTWFSKRVLAPSMPEKK